MIDIFIYTYNFETCEQIYKYKQLADTPRRPRIARMFKHVLIYLHRLTTNIPAN